VPFREQPARWRLAVTVATVAGVFCLAVCVLLIANHVQVRAADPLNHPELLQLRRQLAEASDLNPELVGQIRALDLLARKAYFTSQAHLRMGGHLLLGGVVVLLIALKLATRWRPELPEPAGGPEAAPYWAHTRRARELIAFSSLVLVVVALLAAYLTPIRMPVAEALATTGGAPGSPSSSGQTTPSPADGPSFPDWETAQQHWGSFRGPGGYGVAPEANPPTDWDGESGRNIRWNSSVPISGPNSPVVWGTRIFLSGATSDRRAVFCFDTETGELLWQREVGALPDTPVPAPKVTEDTGHAAPTMVAHGDRACAIFANGDLVCYDFEGRLLWSRNVGVPDNHYGHASSLLAHDDQLFVQLDDSERPRLLALDLASGRERWTVGRETISWASPVCIPTPLGPQLVLASEQDVDAYEPRTGKRLWSVEALGGEVAPSPAFGGSTVFVANEYATASAIRLDFSGGDPPASLAWQWDESLPDVASPVASDTHVYMATSIGDLICLDLASGEHLWTEELDEGFYASPILAGDRIYALDREGVMQIFRAGAEFELLGSPALGETTVATPAFLDGRIYIRTQEHLLCIESREHE